MSKIYTKIIAGKDAPTVTNVLWLDIETNTLKRHSGKGWVSIIGSDSTDEESSTDENNSTDEDSSTSEDNIPE